MLLDNSKQNETDSDSQLWDHIFSLCVQRGWNIGRLAKQANVSRSTLHNWQQGKTSRPQNATLFKLAEALQVAPASLLDGGSMNAAKLNESVSLFSDCESGDEPHCAPEGLMQDRQKNFTQQLTFSSSDKSRLFDRQTNGSIQSVCKQFPSLFEFWSDDEWDELFSSFGTGGELNEAGVREQAIAINAKKETLYQLQVVLETDLAEAARGVIRALFETLQSSNDFDPPEEDKADNTTE